jgi:hypothetical protein
MFASTVAIATLVVLIASCALKPVCRALIRWRAAKLPQGKDAERAREELDGIASELNSAERIELNGWTLTGFAELEREIAERTAEVPNEYTLKASIASAVEVKNAQTANYNPVAMAYVDTLIGKSTEIEQDTAYADLRNFLKARHVADQDIEDFKRYIAEQIARAGI